MGGERRAASGERRVGLLRPPRRAPPRPAPRASRPLSRQSSILRPLLGIARAGGWLLALNCAQNLLLAPRAAASFAELRRFRAPGAWPRVSVLVPARDEAPNIAACLRGLLAQGYPATEILVCDDRSTDDTAAIVRAIAGERGHGRLRLLAGRERPPGWSGKNWACHQLAEAARGEWLLFTDADTRHRPDAVSAALALAWRHDADLVSLLPRHITGTLGERLIVPQLPLIVFAILPVALVRQRRAWTAPFAGANGLFLFFRRDWYDTLGGYPAVREAIAEDMRFALATKRCGGRLVLADGGAVVGCRMYRGFADAWRGCARNAFPAALENLVVFSLFALAWAVFFALPPLALLWLGLAALRRVAPLDAGGARGVVVSRHAVRGAPAGPLIRPPVIGGGGEDARLALAAMAGQLVVRFLVGRRFGRPLWEVALQPVSSILTLGILLDSYRRHRLGGGFAWRGRHYA